MSEFFLRHDWAVFGAVAHDFGFVERRLTAHQSRSIIIIRRFATTLHKDMSLYIQFLSAYFLCQKIEVVQNNDVAAKMRH